MGFSFLPKEAKFFDLFENSASNIVAIAKELNDLLCDWESEDIERRINKISELEHYGDSITHEIAAQLHSTFITPFDREDIAALSDRMDDVTDFIHATADSIFIYQIKEPTDRAKELAGILVLAAEEVAKAVPCLRDKGKLNEILKHCIELNRIENMGDKAYRSALGELFQDSKDVPHIIKWREVYEHMESATDKCEDVANVLEGIALKHA